MRIIIAYLEEARLRHQLAALRQGDAAVLAWCEELHEATMGACNSVPNDDVLELLNQST